MEDCISALVDAVLTKRGGDRTSSLRPSERVALMESLMIHEARMGDGAARQLRMLIDQIERYPAISIVRCTVRPRAERGRRARDRPKLLVTRLVIFS